MSTPTNSLTIAEGSDLNAKDCELIERALDALDRLMQTVLANKGQDAAAGETRSRILIVRTKLQAMANEQSKATERCERLKTGVEDVLGRLHKTNALLIATQFAANEECEFDVSDAIAGIIERVDQHTKTLDRLCTEASRHAQR